jgi:hypothetical protein
MQSIADAPELDEMLTENEIYRVGVDLALTLPVGEFRASKPCPRKLGSSPVAYRRPAGDTLVG